MIKSKLQAITEKARTKSEFQEDIKDFGAYLLQDWVLKCAEAANERQTKIRLLTFPVTAKYKNNKIIDLIQDGVLEFIKNYTELDIIYKEYVVKKNNVEIQEIEPYKHEFNFKIIDSEIFMHIGVLDLSWN